MAKDKTIAFTATEAEAQFLRTIASQMDISVSEYLRSFVFKQAKKDVNKWEIDIALDTFGKSVTYNGVKIR